VQDVTILNKLVERADLVVAIGVKFSHNGAAGFNLGLPQAKLVAVNVAGASRNYPARLHVTGDAGAVARDLLARLVDAFDAAAAEPAVRAVVTPAAR